MSAPRCLAIRRTAIRRDDAGMTLMELLAAITIFLGLAGMVMQVLGSGLELWSGGERERDLRESASSLLDRMSNELVHQMASDLGDDGEARLLFFSDFVEMDSNQRRQVDFRAQRLLFVRSLFEERVDPRLVGAGLTSGEGDWFVAQRPALGTPAPTSNDSRRRVPPDEETPAFLRATEGMVEVAWLPEPDHRVGYEGRFVLWRLLRSPIGGPQSLFRSVADRDGGLRDAEAHVMAENLLYLGFQFLDARTDLGAEPDQTSGPSLTWDSTRGILVPGNSLEAFRYGVGPSSLRRLDDDVYPRAVRIVLALELPPGESRAAFLSEEVPASERSPRIRIRNPGALRALRDGGRLKIGHEWVEVSGVHGDIADVRRRGLYGTTACDHAVDTPLLVGEWAQRTVLLPQSREALALGASR